MQIRYFKKLNNRGKLANYAEFNDVIFRQSGEYYVALKNNKYKTYMKLHDAIFLFYNPNLIIKSDECIHHKDHNKLNNDISNLKKLTISEHQRYHMLNISDSTRKKISTAVSGENHPMYGKKQTETTIKKMSDVKLGDKNPAFIHFTNEQIEYILDLKSKGFGLRKIAKCVNEKYNLKISITPIRRITK